MRIDSSGRVGIGTTAPNFPLEVVGSTANTIVGITATTGAASFKASNTGQTFYVGVDNSANSFLGGGAYSAHLWASGAYPMVFSTNATERARIDSSGRLLVGTSTSVDVGGGPAINQLFSNANSNLFALTLGYAAADGPRIQLGKSRNSAYGSRTIVENNDELGTINFNGDDGTDLNTTGASIVAYVDGTPGANDLPSRLVFSTTADGASSPTERFRLNSNGQLCINTTTATTGIGHRVYIEDGTTYAPMGVNNAAGGTGSSNNIVIYRAGTQVGSITTTNTATAYNTSSDYRLKENVVPLTGAVDRINQLQVHRFNFIGNPDTTVDGFIAHEAQAVVPECVTGTKDEVDADGNPVYQGIDQSKLVPLLTAALQEALAEIESLKARVTALEP
jgi:hypothetical protein